jgi:hypothetical protein
VLPEDERKSRSGVVRTSLHVVMLAWLLGVMFVFWLTQYPLFLGIAHRVPFLGFLIPLREVFLRFFTARYLF